MGFGLLFKEESGSVAVIVALCMTALLGMTAIALDFGKLASDRQHMQNAVDAAALAAAADVAEEKSDETVEDTAEEYCRANGYDAEDEKVELETEISDNEVTVTLRHEVSLGLARLLLNKDTSIVEASATAEAVSIFGACPYSLFAGEKIEEDGSGITITGNSIEINGNIHSNSDISMSHAVLGDGAVATAVGSTNPSSSGWNSGSIALDMPSIRSLKKGFDGKNMVEYHGNVKKQAKDGFQELIDESVESYENQYGDDEYCDTGLYIHITGSLTFNGNASSSYAAEFPIVLIVDGNINLNGTPLDSTEDCPICVISTKGDITVNGGGACYTGIIYAPKGDVTLNGNEAEFRGSVVAQNIRKSGGNITVSYSDQVDRFLPVTKVHLIN